MPIYEYQCNACDERFERLFMSPDQLPKTVECPACQATDTQRLISAPAVHVSGEGSREEDASSESEPPVFGREELNEALERES